MKTDHMNPEAASAPLKESLDETIELQGETVKIHEFRWIESTKAAALARPMLDQVKVLIDQEQLDIGSLESILVEHTDNWIELLSLATGRDAEWLAGLSDTDGWCLTMAFWRVNGGLFMRRLIMANALQFSLNDLWGRFLPQAPARLQ